MSINQIVEQNPSLVFPLVSNIFFTKTSWITANLDPSKNEIKPISFEDNHPNSTSIILDPQSIIQQNRLAFSIYDQKTGLFDNKQYHVLTRLISLTTDRPELVKNVKMNFFLENNFHEKNRHVICAFWKIFDNMTAEWSTKGCYLDNITDISVTCICDHLTHFAVLMVRMGD